MGAAIWKDGVPERALLLALRGHWIAIPAEIIAELVEAVHRPALARFIPPARRQWLLDARTRRSVVLFPSLRVRDCRDPKDDKIPEPAPAAGADTIVASDADLLVLHPWRASGSFRPRGLSPLQVWLTRAGIG